MTVRETWRSGLMICEATHWKIWSRHGW
jgi:hypothetical protein